MVRAFTSGNLLHWWSPLVVVRGGAADLVSGLVHWTADTWFSESMPVLGRRFLRPSVCITSTPMTSCAADFIDCNGDVAMLNTPILVAALVMPDDRRGCGAVAGVDDVCRDLAADESGPSVGAHAVAAAARSLASTLGVILSGDDHARHHEEPFVANYCIATGWCNRWLSAVGFFPACERLITRSGLEPRADERTFQERW